MRLLWASVLVLLPLLAELADAQKCAGQPDAPDYATVRCFKKRNTCRATCQQGYIFSEKNSKMAVYDCEGGEWVMKGGEDRCTPECDPPCENGECIEPDTCDCDEGFAGDYCEEELEDEEEEEEYMTTTEEPITEALDEDEDEEDNYGDEEGDYGDDYEEDEENNDEEEDEEAVEGEGDDDEEHEDGAESTMEPEGEDNEDEDDHEDVDETDDDDVDENVDDNGDDEEVDDVEAGGDDDEDDAGDNTPDTAAYGGVSEVLPKVLVGSAALLIVRLL